MSLIDMLENLASTIEKTRTPQSSSKGYQALDNFVDESKEHIPLNFNRFLKKINSYERLKDDNFQPKKSFPITEFGEFITNCGVLDTSGDIEDFSSVFGFNSPIGSTASLQASALLPAIQLCGQGIQEIVSGIQSQNHMSTAVGTGKVLLFNSNVVGAGLKIGSIAGADYLLAGAGAVLNIYALAEGITHIYRRFGSHTASRTLFALLLHRSPTSFVSHSPCSFSGKKRAKISLLHGLNPLMASFHWVGYKYRPHWLIEAQEFISKIGIPLLGLAASILAIVAISTSFATLGIVPLVLSATGAAISTGLLIKRGIGYHQSKHIYEKHIFPSLSEEQKHEINFCLTGTHRYFGATHGDYFRYQVARILSLKWIDSEQNRGIHKTQNPIEHISFTILEGLSECTWDILRRDIGERNHAKLCTEIDEHFLKPASPLNQNKFSEFQIARLKTLKALFNVFR